jgi:hypothetical protein
MPAAKKKTVDEMVDDILADVPYNAQNTVTLPSGGVATLRPITFEEEKQILSLSKKGVDPSQVLLENCVSDIDKSDILLVDKIYLLFKLRELSFGSVYKFVVGCPSCHQENRISVDLNDMPVVSLEDMGREVEIQLPMCKKPAKVKLASMSDEVYMSDPELLMDNLWRFIISINDVENDMVIQKAIKKLPAGDINTIMSTVMCEGYGLTTEIRVLCSHCGHDSVMELPLNKNFFSAS